MKYIIFSIVGFFLGGILFSYYIPMALKKVNIIEKSRDHNPGTANAIKYAGPVIGIICLLCDIFKGFIPVFLGAGSLNKNSILFSIVMAAPVIGHAVSPWKKNCGGKSVAVSFGVLLGVLAYTKSVFIVALVYIFFSVIVILQPNEKRTVTAFGLLQIFSLIEIIRNGYNGIYIGNILISAVVIYKNFNEYDNIGEKFKRYITANISRNKYKN